jgi:glycosyltransferase involved in cell wall biosynthesis
MTTSLDIVIPVLNEEAGLAASVGKLRDFLSERMGDYRWRIVVADNGSSDATPEIGKRLSWEDERIGYVRLEQRGRGRALSRAWRESEADIVGYMDVDLSTDLDALPALAEAVRSEGYDVAVGSRLRPGARVTGRSFRRELVSRAYSAVFRSMFLTGFRDAQCGFKAVTRRVVDDVVPLVKDTGWFFDTELLILAEKNGYRVKEVPVTWTDDPDSRVKLVGTAYGDMMGLLRLRLGGLRKASMALRSDYRTADDERP